MEKIKAGTVLSVFEPGEFRKNLEKTRLFLEKGRCNNCDLVVFPELNLTGYVTGEDVCDTAIEFDFEFKTNLELLSLEYSISFLCGFTEKRDDKFFASHVFVQNGKFSGIYRKLQPGPPELSHISPGNEIPVFNFSGWKFGIQLCFDAHFPEISTIMAEKGADLLIIPHASPRGSSQEKFESWKRHLLARAYDNGLYVIAVNQCGLNKRNLYFPGVSLLVSPSGRVESFCLEEKETFFCFELSKSAIAEVKTHRMKNFLRYRRKEFYNNYPNIKS
ncbi:MAG: amidohydrolase [Desulfobacteraceae bacterium]|nr:amidohydrolase [Desulfobacteraceae bacterium]MCB9494825.1 amidohydrolase [Desulfobacteraceae bacterium]